VMTANSLTAPLARKPSPDRRMFRSPPPEFRALEGGYEARGRFQIRQRPDFFCGIGPTVVSGRAIAKSRNLKTMCLSYAACGG
jgi:hypothetical protein